MRTRIEENAPPRRMAAGALARIALAVAGLMASALACAGPAAAQTVDEIKKKGVVVVGVQADQLPWGFIDANGQNAGYDVDVANLIAKDMGVKVQFERVTVPNRIATLVTGKVDALAAVMGMYPDRAKVVQFTKPYSVVDIILIGKPDAKVQGMDGLKPFRVGVARASAQDIAITKAAPPGTSIQRFDDDSATVQALVAGQVDVIGGNNTYVQNLERIAGPGKFERKFLINRQYNGLSVRLGQKDLTDWLNAFIDRNLANGELNKISKKWVGVDLPEFPKELPGIPFTVQP
jgi:polar amino acid transport system substrate-binding protein